MLYEQLADYYDLTHGSLTDDIGFVLHLAAQQPGPILELGCGTGRLLAPLAAAGHTIVGLDNSPAMLARARQRLAALPEEAAARVTLVEGDMTAFALDQTFGLILVSYNSFMHLEPTAMRRALRCLAGHLRDDGQLFLDLANPQIIALTPNDDALTLEARFTNPANGQQVLQFATSRVDEISQQLLITWIYDEMPPAGGPISRRVYDVTYHYRYPHQLELDLTDAGLALQKLYGFYNHEAYEEMSERMLVLAGK